MSSAHTPSSNKSEDKYLGRPAYDALPRLNYTQSPHHNPIVYPPQHSEPGHASIVSPITHGVHTYYDPEQARAEPSPESFGDSTKKQAWSRTNSDHETYEYTTEDVDSRARLLSADGGTKVWERFVDK